MEDVDEDMYNADSDNGNSSEDEEGLGQGNANADWLKEIPPEVCADAVCLVCCSCSVTVQNGV